MKTWKDIGFEIEITADGSPSLRLLQSADPAREKGESMHHSGGANAETQIIYSKPILEVLKNTKNPSFLVVGLGLGYIELCIAKESLELGKMPQDIERITSYESVPELKEFFISWLHGQSELHPEVQGTYDLLANFIIQGTNFSAEDLKSFLKSHFKVANDIQGALLEDAIFAYRYNGIMYDAFSSKTTPHLWEEGFIRRLLLEASQDNSLFSTYACRASLKRALAENEYQVIVREGFQGKRNSTLGLRGSFKQN